MALKGEKNSTLLGTLRLRNNSRKFAISVRTKNSKISSACFDKLRFGENMKHFRRRRSLFSNKGYKNPLDNGVKGEDTKCFPFDLLKQNRA